MLNHLNRQLEKFLPLMTPVSVLIGVLLGDHLSSFAYLSPWIFAIMTFSGSISTNLKQFMKVLARPFPLIATFFILHLIMPLLALQLGQAIYRDDTFTVTGLILLAAIPTGIASFVWVSIYKGNIALTLSIILVDTILSPLVVPYTLFLFLGTRVHMDIAAMTQGLFLMIVLPSIAGMLLNQWSKGQIVQRWSPMLSPFSKIALGVVIAINSSVVSPYLRHIDSKMMEMALTVLVLISFGYMLGWLCAKLMRWDQDIVIALTYNGGMRNISAGAVLAVSYFAPPVAVPVILGTIFQQSLASFFGYIINKRASLSMEKSRYDS
ncbi:bile acid:sodium symporter family protein [Paenibacillus solisilvae]|uniref:Bile acid:sodium symporter family protein n=1 Tax=Paenibacillus solisilvae TaxID=2486751 RepID=A0ABW0VST9_9BACL